MSLPAILERGSGPAVLLVHGLAGFKEGWGPLPDAIAAAGARAVAVDLPGVGRTPRRVAGPLTPERLADGLAGLLEDIGPAAVVGHSLGAQVAGVLACRARASVTRLALIAPSAAPWSAGPPRRGVARLMRVPLFGRALARPAVRWLRRSPERRRRAFLAAAAEPERLAAEPEMAGLLAEATARLATADVGALVDWAAAGVDRDMRTWAGAIAQPTLVVAGGRDRVSRPEAARELAGALPRGRLLPVPDAAHYPHLERPERVVPELVAHLTGAAGEPAR